MASLGQSSRRSVPHRQSISDVEVVGCTFADTEVAGQKVDATFDIRSTADSPLAVKLSVKLDGQEVRRDWVDGGDDSVAPNDTTRAQLDFPAPETPGTYEVSGEVVAVDTAGGFLDPPEEDPSEDYPIELRNVEVTEVDDNPFGYVDIQVTAYDEGYPIGEYFEIRIDGQFATEKLVMEGNGPEITFEMQVNLASNSCKIFGASGGVAPLTVYVPSSGASATTDQAINWPAVENCA